MKGTPTRQALASVPESIGHYRIIRPLGTGGMGQVYLAEDTKLGRQVAIKLLPPEDSNQPQSRKRLLKEAQAAAKLDHPNVCSIFEVGESASGAYIAMQFIEGQTLGDLMQDRKPSIAEVAQWGAEVADALDEAHRQGLVHRDIKPQNIMITTKGQAKVLDFGLAKDVKAMPANMMTSTLMTSPGMVVGTVPYMSPEQVKGEDLDGRSDLFSLGAVLYEAATGRRPFQAKSGAELMSAILVSEPAMLLEGSSELHPEMKRVLKRCLTKDPNTRYANAGLMRDDLRGLFQTMKTSQHPRSADFSRPLPWKRILAGAAALVVLGAAAWGAVAWRAASAAGESNSVAVLPFVNTGQDPQVDYLSDGLAEGLIDQLSRVPGLKVIAWTSASRYKSPNPDLKAIAKDLGVKTVLVGRVLNRPEGLSIRVELADAEDGHHIWGEQFTKPVNDLPGIQDSIAMGVTGAIGSAKGATAELNPIHTSGEAYQLYLKGRFYADKFTPDNAQRGLDYFDQALKLDPDFALAHVGKAYAYWGLSSQFMAPAEAMPKVKTEAEAALRMNPDLAEAHTALAIAKAVYDHDFPGAEREYQTAIRLNPGSAVAHEYYAYVLIGQNRYQDCKTQLDTARNLDPLSSLLEFFAGWNELWVKKDAPSARAHLQKSVDLQPDFWWPYCFIAQIDEAQGHPDMAVHALDKAQAVGGSTYVLGVRGFESAKRGDRAEAQRLLKELLSTRLEATYLSPMHPAMIYAGLGDHANAMTWLQKAYDARDEVCLLLQVDPTWDGLRDDPAFKALVAKIDRRR
ncbi:MAG TPA: protein kinase [Holophagaceae bacterium]|jgi:serine/threonine protein kinase/tetratricopeptide (TPR) repeat protein|nr:protein kinase [Holophagaceae bacterium]